MGSIRFVVDAHDEGATISLHDHEGWVERSASLAETWASEPGWSSSWPALADEQPAFIRAACECGWHGPVFPWGQGYPNEDQYEALMLAWDRHIEVDVIRGLAWTQCVECGDPFEANLQGRPARYCSTACRSAGQRARSL